MFTDELTNWLIDEAGFKQSQCQIYMYYNYVPDGSNLGVIYYIDDCVYWYTYEELGNVFVDILGNIFHVNFLVYSHWFISISISKLKYHYISVDQARYYTSVVAKYLDTATIK